MLCPFSAQFLNLEGAFVLQRVFCCFLGDLHVGESDSLSPG